MTLHHISPAMTERQRKIHFAIKEVQDADPGTYRNPELIVRGLTHLFNNSK